ncbi:MAG: dTMP kinase [Gloeomargarita sp. SKYBB_i_bin120]|nr:dTMP kinase [Gloeomargarita sp. SKYG98]MCS7291561.1 dTMP kinase [Gloeomargarita sp. SKYB120]MDW8177121.1 dTMP kinase [Gloeomargarita sp. SKYBB_i_bin120]
MAGCFISLEGIEGAGKTTQMHRLAAWLQRLGYSVLTTREPGGTALGQSLRSLLLHHVLPERSELLLYAADRAAHVAQVLQPALQRQQVVLCDRYTDSTVAYQGYGRGMDLHLIEQVNAIATGGLMPDLTLWLDVPVEVGLRRVRGRGALNTIEQESLAFHERVRQGYQALAEQHPQRICRIDAASDTETVFKQIQAAIEGRWSAHASECQ